MHIVWTYTLWLRLELNKYITHTLAHFPTVVALLDPSRQLIYLAVHLSFSRCRHPRGWPARALWRSDVIHIPPRSLQSERAKHLFTLGNCAELFFSDPVEAIWSKMMALQTGIYVWNRTDELVTVRRVEKTNEINTNNVPLYWNMNNENM